MTQTLTIDILKDRFASAFPGCVQTSGSSMNGEWVTVTFWEFQVHATITTKKHSPADVVGEVRLRFNRYFENHIIEGSKGRIKVIRSSSVTTEPELVDFLNECTGQVRGVVQLLMTVFEPIPEEPELTGLAGMLARSL